MPSHRDRKFNVETAVLGTLALPPQPILVALRSWELSHILAAAKIADRHFASLSLFGITHHIGSCVLAASALTFMQMLFASLIFARLPRGLRWEVVWWLSATAWLMLSGGELASALIYAHDRLEQASAFAVALLLCMSETVAGILIIDGLVIPFFER